MKILNEIANERIRQDEKWGEQNHSLSLWLAILGEEFGEVSKEVVEFYFAKAKSSLSTKSETYGMQSDENNMLQRLILENYRKELIQVAAVCVSMIESLERNELSYFKN